MGTPGFPGWATGKMELLFPKLGQAGYARGGGARRGE